MSNVILPSGVTQEMLAEWKKEHGPLDMIVVTDKNDPSRRFSCIVRQPGKRAIGMALKFADKDMYKLCDVLLKDCWVAGDEIIKEHAQHVITAGAKISEKIDQAEADLINL